VDYRYAIQNQIKSFGSDVFYGDRRKPILLGVSRGRNTRGGRSLVLFPQTQSLFALLMLRGLGGGTHFYSNGHLSSNL